MSMKLSDLMLDLATGDASSYDVDIANSIGKIKTSSAIFEYAVLVSEMPEDSVRYVQEAADAMGLPTDTDGANEIASEAIGNELKALVDATVDCAKKVKQATDKDMKAILTVGKKFGISASSIENGNFMSSFAEPFATAVASIDNATPAKKRMKGRTINLSGKKFIGGHYSKKLAKHYGQGMADLLSTFGISIDKVFDDQTVSEYLSINDGFVNGLKSTAGKIIGMDDSRVNKRKLGYDAYSAKLAEDLEWGLSNASKLLKFDKIISDTHYTSNVKHDDIVEMVVALYCVYHVSSAIAATSASEKKAAVEYFTNVLSESAGDSKQKNALTDIDKTVKDISYVITSVAEDVVKAFSDSTYALIDALNGGESAADE